VRVRRSASRRTALTALDAPVGTPELPARGRPASTKAEMWTVRGLDEGVKSHEIEESGRGRSVYPGEQPMRYESGALEHAPLVTSERDVVALVAHELKHPLAAIEMALPLLADAERREHARQVIERQVAYLRRLVGDLLDAERARRGDLQLEQKPIDLRSILAEAISTFRIRARERGVTLSKTIPSAPVVVSGDGVRLQQVISNILDNAIQHTKAGDTIDARLQATTREALIAVSDTGDGIAPSFLPKIFEPFRHGSGGGLGLGLNVARRIIELHGGRITAHSAGPGQGSEFVVALPLGGDDASRIAASSTS